MYSRILGLTTTALILAYGTIGALPHAIGAVYKKRAGYSADITMTQ